MIVYTDHVFREKASTKNTQGPVRESLTSGLRIADTYNLFKLQEGCSIEMDLGLIKQLPESDDKFRGCFVSVFEDESEGALDNSTYTAERAESKVLIKTYGNMSKEDFSEFFCTRYIERVLTSEIYVRVDKPQTTIVFNNTPLFIVDAVLCLHKDYFFAHFQSVMPTTTSDYQSCLIMKPKPHSVEQTHDEIQRQVGIAIKNFIALMQEFEQSLIEELQRSKK
jgi:hypothetical protein